MKFFTPELLKRFQSEDDTIFELASDEWELNRTAYDNYIKELKLPSILDRFFNEVNLHDSVVSEYTEVELCKTKLQLVINQNDNSNYLHYLILKYDLVKPVEIFNHFSEESTSKEYVLYDELAKVDEYYVHNILSNNGRELQISFSDFHFTKIMYNKKEIIEL